MGLPTHQEKAEKLLNGLQGAMEKAEERALAHAVLALVESVDEIAQRLVMIDNSIQQAVNR